MDSLFRGRLPKDRSVDRLGPSSHAPDAELTRYVELLSAKCPSDEARAAFVAEMANFGRLLARYKTAKQLVPLVWSDVKQPPADMLCRQSALSPCSEARKAELASKLCVLKLNGGLGTSMGCTGPKSIIEVRSDLSFLDITVLQMEELNQRHGAAMPLLLMNSFNTHRDTQEVIAKYAAHTTKIETFNQSQFPRILKDGMLPLGLCFQDDDKDHWYPPGHGDVYRALVRSGVLQRMLQQGREYVFISNIDNLGATVDFDILNYMLDTGCDFVMEVTDKQRQDVKGGTLIEYDGKARLLELAQCPADKVEDFKSISTFKIFNTNNLWVSLRAIERLVAEHRVEQLDLIVNCKKVLGKEVVQLETAAGSAIQFFDNAKGINVDRSRFLPVKSTSDLFLLQSNLYELDRTALRFCPRRHLTSVPLINLGEYYKTVSDFAARFRTIPDISELEHLTVTGDVTFGAGVVLKGTVIIVASHGSRIDIPAGSVLENKVVTGSLRVLER